MNYCIDLKNCKRTLIARHFNDDVWHDTGKCNEMCDYCKQTAKNEIEKIDCIKEAQLVINILDKNSNKSNEKRLTANKLAELVYSDLNSKHKKAEYPNKLNQNEIENLVLVMLMNSYLKEDFHFTPYNTICYIVKGPLAPHLEYDANFYMDLLKGSTKRSDQTNIVNKKPESSFQINNHQDSIEEIIESDEDAKDGLFFDDDDDFKVKKNKKKNTDEIIEIDSSDECKNKKQKVN